MPTELEELVGFLHHGNTPIRQISAENLVTYSKSRPAIFKAHQLAPVKDLKLLVKDYPPIAKNALTILVNISSDHEVLKVLADDDAFLETLLLRVTSVQEPNGDFIAMLLANLAKSPSLERLIALHRSIIPALSSSPLAITQLLELFNVGSTGKYNKAASYDYLAYLFADLVKYTSFQKYLTTTPPPPPTSTSISIPPPSDPEPPITTFLPLTTHPSHPRRLGTATLLRNLALAHPSPLSLIQQQQPQPSQSSSSLLPSLLLPLCSSNQSNITPEEMDLLPLDCQYLSPDEGDDKEEKDGAIVLFLLETLYLLIARTGKEGREIVRGQGTYVVVRECHLRWAGGGGNGDGEGDVNRDGDEGVRSACERVVDVLMVEEGERDEAKRGGFAVEQGEEGKEGEGGGGGRGGGGGGSGGAKNIRGSGFPHAHASKGGGDLKAITIGPGPETSSKPAAEVGKVNVAAVKDDDDEEDEDNAIVPIF